MFLFFLYFLGLFFSFLSLCAPSFLPWGQCAVLWLRASVAVRRCRVLCHVFSWLEGHPHRAEPLASPWLSAGLAHAFPQTEGWVVLSIDFHVSFSSKTSISWERDGEELFGWLLPFSFRVNDRGRLREKRRGLHSLAASHLLSVPSSRPALIQVYLQVKKEACKTVNISPSSKQQFANKIP